MNLEKCLLFPNMYKQECSHCASSVKEIAPKVKPIEKSGPLSRREIKRKRDEKELRLWVEYVESCGGVVHEPMGGHGQGKEGFSTWLTTNGHESDDPILSSFSTLGQLAQKHGYIIKNKGRLWQLTGKKWIGLSDRLPKNEIQAESWLRSHGRIKEADELLEYLASKEKFKVLSKNSKTIMSQIRQEILTN